MKIRLASIGFIFLKFFHAAGLFRIMRLLVSLILRPFGFIHENRTLLSFLMGKYLWIIAIRLRVVTRQNRMVPQYLLEAVVLFIFIWVLFTYLYRIGPKSFLILVLRFIGILFHIWEVIGVLFYIGEVIIGVLFHIWKVLSTLIFFFT